MSTGLWHPSEPPEPQNGYANTLKVSDTAELLAWIKNSNAMPKKEYEQLAFLFSHITDLEKEVRRLTSVNGRLVSQVKRMSPAYEAEMWREPYNGPVDQGQL